MGDGLEFCLFCSHLTLPEYVHKRIVFTVMQRICCPSLACVAPIRRFKTHSL